MEANEISKNQNIVQTVLNDTIANNWSTDQYNPYKLTTIAPDTSEYRQINNRFTSTFRGYCIANLQRIENPYLLGQYLLKKEKLLEENAWANEQFLFHGTKLRNIDGICKNNLDWRLKGKNRGHKFGQGVSFSPSAFYAHHYGDIMLLVRVLIGKSTVGNILTKIPPEPYDTTTNGKNTVYVKYEDDDFYPEYVIRYESDLSNLLKDLYL